MELARERRAQGVRVEAVALDWLWGDESSPQTVEAFAAFAGEHELTLPIAVVRGTDADLEALAARYGISTGLPTTFVLDAHGNVVDREEGPAERARFEAMLARAQGP